MRKPTCIEGHRCRVDRYRAVPDDRCQTVGTALYNGESIAGAPMRPMLVVTLSLVLLGCAHAPQLPDGAEIASLSPGQLRQAFDGKGSCIHEEDGACESMILVDSTNRFRSVGAT